MTLSDQQRESIVKEIYLIFKDKRSNQNWVRNEPSWDQLGDEEKAWWKEFCVTLLHKVALEQKLAKSKESKED